MRKKAVYDWQARKEVLVSKRVELNVFPDIIYCLYFLIYASVCASILALVWFVPTVPMSPITFFGRALVSIIIVMISVAIYNLAAAEEWWWEFKGLINLKGWIVYFRYLQSSEYRHDYTHSLEKKRQRGAEDAVLEKLFS